MLEKKSHLSILLGILLLFGLYLTSLYSYLLFHSLAEIFSIIVACSIFGLMWNSRHFMDNTYLLFIGTAYLFIGGLDLIHTLAYKGMNIFREHGTNLPTQLWIGARYTESLTLLIAPFFLGRRLRLRYVIIGYSLAVSLLIGSIFYWHVFPACFVEGKGLTAFKKTSEYIICLFLFGSILLLFKKRLEFDAHMLRLLMASILLSICSELAFTLYVHAYGLSNLIGHYLKIISFYLIYKAIVETGLTRPYALLFRNLKQSEEALRYRLAFEDLISNISTRFISMTSEKTDQGVEEALEEIGRFANADGGYVFLFSDDMKRFSMTHLWRTENLSTEKTELQDLDSTSMPWWMEKLSRHEPIVVPSISDLQKDAAVEKSIIAAQGIQSLVDVPMVYLGNVIGFLGFSCVRTQREWTDDEISLLRLVGQVIANALQYKKTEAQIIRAKQEWERTFDAVPDLISVIDDDQRIVRANKALADRLGCSPQELVGRSCYVAVHGTDKPPESCPHVHLMADGRDHVTEVHEDRLGGHFVVSVSALHDSNGRPVGSVHVARDITRRKQAEEELRKARDDLEIRVEERTAELKRLSAQLLSVQEDERKRIARELHDSIGQSLVAIKFGAENAMQQVLQGKNQEGVESLEVLVPVVRQASEEVRRIHTDLRPTLLDDLGILTTISWLCREFEKLHEGMEIRKDLEIKEEEVPESLKIVIFRILQEALNNVAKYSKAGAVSVSLKIKGSLIELGITDNGQGFDAQQVRSARRLGRGFGLTSMKERTELSGGRFSVESKKGVGTILRATWKGEG
jgi:PAS domain S-box-containing protein